MVEILASVGSCARRTLPPRAFEFVRFPGWCLAVYFPRLISSWFVKSAPEIHGFGHNGASELVNHLRSINALAPTEMCWIMSKHRSDKGSWRWHNYTTVYSRLLKGRRHQPLRIFELGLGTTNPDLASTMGANGLPGASLRGWCEFFPNALVYGADIDRDILFQEDRIKTFYCDQLDQAAIRDLWSQPDLQNGADIIIEDGLHTFEANISFLESSLDHLCPGGFYIVEDISQGDVEKWRYQLGNVYSSKYPDYEFAFVALAKSIARSDNNLLVIHRPRP
jgi:SAM-dependent methyltransferase